MEWKTIERPGYLGKKRDEIIGSWDKKYNVGNWRLMYVWGEEIIPREMALQIYERGYYEFLKENKETLEWLIKTASDVYDTAPSNVNSGFDYKVQETQNNHLHDIAIRRALARLGEKFRGDRLIHVRWKDSDGYKLSPGIVPFHLPKLIVPGEIKSYSGKTPWWNDGSIEDFYQRNKILQVKS